MLAQEEAKKIQQEATGIVIHIRRTHVITETDTQDVPSTQGQWAGISSRVAPIRPDVDQTFIDVPSPKVAEPSLGSSSIMALLGVSFPYLFSIPVCDAKQN